VPVTREGLARAAERDLRVRLMAGAWDWTLERTQRLRDDLQAAGVTADLDVMPKTGHGVSRFSPLATEALRYLLGDRTVAPPHPMSGGGA
jgi:enterochelin esterase-like enzyme